VRRKVSISSDSGRLDSVAAAAAIAGWNEINNAIPIPASKNCFLFHAFDCNDVVEEDEMDGLVIRWLFWFEPLIKPWEL
jgi:hypothetical protein